MDRDTPPIFREELTEFAGRAAEDLEKAIADGNRLAPLFAIGLAIFIDFFDLIIAPVYLIPVVGVIIAVLIIVFVKFTVLIILNLMLWHVGGFIRWKVRFAIFGATFFELIPVLNWSPIYTISMIWAFLEIKKQAHLAQEELVARDAAEAEYYYSLPDFDSR